MSPMRTSVLLVSLFLGLVCAAPFDELNNDVPIAPLADVDGYRLGTNFMPESYIIRLKPYLEGSNQFTFDGEAVIRVKAEVTSNELQIHARNLTNVVLTVAPTTGAAFTVLTTTHNSTTDIYKYTLSRQIAVNEIIVLSYQYKGMMLDDMHGFYRSSYTDAKGNTK